MWRPIALFLASATIYLSTNAQSSFTPGPSGICLAVPLTTIEIKPLSYSNYFPSATVIDIFGNGDTLNIYGPTTIISTTTVTVTSSPTAPASPGFNIQIQGLSLKDKRAVSYIGFSGGPNDHGIVVGSQTQAAVFGIIGDFLISDGDFIETELGIGFLQLQKMFTPPTDDSIWLANATSVELINSAFSIGNGQALFCVASDQSIYVELTLEPPFICTQVTLSAVPALNSPGSLNTSSTSGIVISPSSFLSTMTSSSDTSPTGSGGLPPASQTSSSMTSTISMGYLTETTTSSMGTSTTTSTTTGMTPSTSATTSTATGATSGLTTSTSSILQPPTSPSQYNTVAYTLPVSSGAPPPTTGVVTVKSTGGYTAGGDPGTPFTVATVGTDGITSTVVIVSPIVSLGEGLPTGSAPVVSFPSPIILGIGPNEQARFAENVEARQAAPSSTPTAATNFVQGGAGAEGNCGFATRYTLVNGMLYSGNETVGKSLNALFAPVVVSTPMDIETTWYFADGELGWNTTDVGDATFYLCGGNFVYAGFPGWVPYSNCTVSPVGPINAAACPVNYNDPAATAQVTLVTIYTTTTSATSLSTSSPTTTATSTNSITTSTTTTSATTTSIATSPTASSTLTAPSTTTATVVMSPVLPTISTSTTSSVVINSPSSSAPIVVSSSSAAVPPSASVVVPGSSSVVAPASSSSPAVASSSAPVPASSSTAPIEGSSTPLFSSSLTPSSVGVPVSTPMSSTVAVASSIQGTSSVLFVSSTSAFTQSSSIAPPSSNVPGLSTTLSSSIAPSSSIAQGPSTALPSSIASSSGIASGPAISAGNAPIFSSTSPSVPVPVISVGVSTSVVSSTPGLFNMPGTSSTLGSSPIPASSSLNAGISTTSSSSGASSTNIGQAYCPSQSFTIVQNGNYYYEVECNYQYQGQDLGIPPGIVVTSFYTCIQACNYWNDQGGAGNCLFVVYGGNSACYPKSSFTSGQQASAIYSMARLIYAGYPSITDNPSVVYDYSASSNVASPSPSSSSVADISSSIVSMASSSGLSSNSILTAGPASSSIAFSVLDTTSSIAVSSSITSTSSSVVSSQSSPSSLTTSSLASLLPSTLSSSALSATASSSTGSLSSFAGSTASSSTESNAISSSVSSNLSGSANSSPSSSASVPPTTSTNTVSTFSTGTGTTSSSSLASSTSIAPSLSSISPSISSYTSSVSISSTSGMFSTSSLSTYSSLSSFSTSSSSSLIPTFTTSGSTVSSSSSISSTPSSSISSVSLGSSNSLLSSSSLISSSSSTLSSSSGPVSSSTLSSSVTSSSGSSSTTSSSSLPSSSSSISATLSASSTSSSTSSASSSASSSSTMGASSSTSSTVASSSISSILSSTASSTTSTSSSITTNASSSVSPISSSFATTSSSIPPSSTLSTGTVTNSVYTGPYITSTLATTLSNVLCSGFNLATPTSTSYGLSSTTYTSSYTTTVAGTTSTITTTVTSTSTTSTTYFLPTGVNNVFNGGAYLFQKVQYGAFTYEIECYSGWGGGTTNVGASSFENCMQSCNNNNANNGIGNCVAAIWQPNSPPATGGSCYLSSDSTQSSFYNSGQRLARLIWNSYPRVTDAIYLQPTTSNLGLCTASASYAMQVIFPQYTDGTYTSGPGTGTQYYYENECGAYYFPTGGLLGLNGIALSTLPTALQNPASAEDCLRSCNYVNRNYQTNQAGSLTYNCQVYLWATNTNTCTLWKLVDTLRVVDANYYSGKYLVASPPENAVSDRPAGFGYKRRVLDESIPVPTPAPDFDVHALISDRPANFGVVAKERIYKLGW